VRKSQNWMPITSLPRIPVYKNASLGSRMTSGWPSKRLLQPLQAHELITIISKTHRYQVIEHGRAKITALLAARAASTKKLLQAA
jgi:hypothetical protein